MLSPIIAFRLLVKEVNGLKIPMEKVIVSTRGMGKGGSSEAEAWLWETGGTAAV
jgi:hypothetical protein